MLNTVSGLSGALLDPAVPRPVPKPLLKSNLVPHIKKLLEALVCQHLHGKDTSVSQFWGHWGAFPSGGGCLMLPTPGTEP